MPILTHKLQSDSNLFITSEKLKNKLLNEGKNSLQINLLVQNLESRDGKKGEWW
jgi:hypothetical protein